MHGWSILRCFIAHNCILCIQPFLTIAFIFLAVSKSQYPDNSAVVFIRTSIIPEYARKKSADSFFAFVVELPCYASVRLLQILIIAGVHSAGAVHPFGDMVAHLVVVSI